MANGLLLAAFTFADVAVDEFNDWYDTEHIPERHRVPGFLSGERWIGAEDPRTSVAIYDLQSPEVLAGAAYKAIAGPNLSPWSKRITGKCKRILRFEGEQTLPGNAVSPQGAGALLVNAMNVPAEVEEDFNAWYDREHIPALAAVPGCLSARRFRATASPVKYVALYHLTSPEVCTSSQWKQAVETPWTERIRPHFRDRVRIVCRSYRRGA